MGKLEEIITSLMASAKEHDADPDPDGISSFANEVRTAANMVDEVSEEVYVRHLG